MHGGSILKRRHSNAEPWSEDRYRSPVSTSVLLLQVVIPLAIEDWLQPAATTLAALVAIAGVIISTVIQRRTGRETVRQAERSSDAADRASKASERSADSSQVSATAAERSSRAAEKSVEVNERIADQVGQRAVAEALAKRYQDAAAQLGHERAAVRIAGVYAMARLADDWEDQRQSCVDVLCACLRTPVLANSGLASKREDPADLKVRETVWSVLKDHLIPGTLNISWRDQRFDFSGALIRNQALEHLTFDKQVRFNHAMFAGDSHLTNVLFLGGASFDDCEIKGTLTLSDVRGRAGPVTFRRAQIGKGATLTLWTNSRPSTADDEPTDLGLLNIGGLLDISVVQSRYVQPRMTLHRAHLRQGAKAKIRSALSLSKDPAVKWPQGVELGEWRYETPCTLDIGQNLLDNGVVRWWGLGDNRIPEGVDLTFRLAYGRSSDQPD